MLQPRSLKGFAVALVPQARPFAVTVWNSGSTLLGIHRIQQLPERRAQPRRKLNPPLVLGRDCCDHLHGMRQLRSISKTQNHKHDRAYPLSTPLGGLTCLCYEGSCLQRRCGVRPTEAAEQLHYKEKCKCTPEGKQKQNAEQHCCHWKH